MKISTLRTVSLLHPGVLPCKWQSVTTTCLVRCHVSWDEDHGSCWQGLLAGHRAIFLQYSFHQSRLTQALVGASLGRVGLCARGAPGVGHDVGDGDAARGIWREHAPQQVAAGLAHALGGLREQEVVPENPNPEV